MEVKMSRKRMRRTKELKFKIALEAVKGEKQVNEIAKEYNVHPQQVTQWKRELLENGAEIFSGKVEKKLQENEKEKDKLYQAIGYQQVQIDWLKKKLGFSE
jgi:transposase-like protein